MTYDTVVKIQRPLGGSGPDWVPCFLIYDKGRTLIHEVPVESEGGLSLCGYFDHPEGEEPPLKVYVEAHLDSEGMLYMGERVSDEEW